MKYNNKFAIGYSKYKQQQKDVIGTGFLGPRQLHTRMIRSIGGSQITDSNAVPLVVKNVIEKKRINFLTA